MTSMARLAFVAGAALALTGCEGVKEQLGLSKQAPDEFRVVARAPLTLPPDFTLRPPEPGLPRPQEGTPTDQARRALFRNDTALAARNPDAAAPQGGRSQGELSLLQAAGADRVDPGIRSVVERETKELNASDADFLELLVFWRDEEPAGVIVDADAETRRLRENAALGKEVTAGETPTIERRRKALLEGIF
jgi:hypothetical protein